MSWYREGEDPDGTRHYTVEDRWGQRRKVSLTRAQRRRMNRVMGLYVCGVVGLGLVGWAIGHGRGHGGLGFVIGLGSGLLALSIATSLGGAVFGIAGYFRQPKD